MEEGQGVPHPIVLGDLEPAGGQAPRVESSVVGHQAALRLGGCPGRVEHEGRLVGLYQTAGGEHVLVLDRAGERRESCLCDHARGLPGAEGHECAEPRSRLERQELRIGRLREAGQAGTQAFDEVDVILDDVAREEQVELGVLDDVAELTCPEARVDRHDDRSEQLGTEEGEHEVRAVRHQQPDVVAAADAEGGERPGGRSERS